MVFRRLFGYGVVAGLLFIAGVTSVSSVFAEQSQSSAISSGFSSSDTALVQGALVSTLDDNAGAVELATLASRERLTGVVSSDALIKLSQDQTSTVQVVMGGTTLALVSDINGEIRAGDKITVSPINGVGMLAIGDGQIVGTALQTFDAEAASSQQITDQQGARKEVRIGAIPIQVDVAYYSAPTSQFIPPFLGNIANDIAGRPVSGLRIVLALILILLAFSCIFALIFTSVKAGMLSLGRNPLAAGAIHRGMANVVVIALLVMVAALVLTYLILTL